MAKRIPNYFDMLVKFDLAGMGASCSFRSREQIVHIHSMDHIRKTEIMAHYKVGFRDQCWGRVPQHRVLIFRSLTSSKSWLF